jgi:murein DD-endopeptidase MepM/ murein hydrolase activator NlpD
MFDAIAVPSGVPIKRLRPGDVLLRYIPGEGYIHIAFINSDNLLLPAQAVAQGWTLETMRPGYYGLVVEAGAFPHRAQQRYARRLLDARGTVPSNQLILRVRRSPSPETVDEQIQIEGNDEQVQPEDIDELWGLDDDAESILIEDVYENNPPPMTPTRPPMAVPSSNPAPFAPLPPAGSYWPIITNHRLGRTVSYTADDGSIVGQSARRWLADRSSGTRYHIRIDLFANYGDPVVAIEDGEIIDSRPFCCGDNKTTNSLLVAHANVVVNYGEVAPDSLRRNGLSSGSRVRAGQIIAYVGRNPGRCDQANQIPCGDSMIHFETYAPGTRRINRWMKNQPRPANVLNPTQYLLHLQEHGLVGTGGSSGYSVPTTPTTPSTPSVTGDRRSPAYIRWVQSSLNQVMNAGLYHFDKVLLQLKSFLLFRKKDGLSKSNYG